jgi:hypothetical protein
MALAKSLTSTCTGELPLLRTGYAIVYGIDYVIGYAIGHTIDQVNVIFEWIVTLGIC